MNTSEDAGKLILRLALGILILLHGRAQISDRYPRDSCADNAHLRPESLVSLGLGYFSRRSPARYASPSVALADE